MRRSAQVAVVLALLGAMPPAKGQDLRVAIRGEFVVDPQFMFGLNNMAIARYVYDSFVDRDAEGYPRNGITESWEQVDDLTWEFRIRPGVTFSDGSKLTAEDVKFSLDRIPNVPENPNPYTSSLRGINGIEMPDPMTIRIHTDRPNPVLPGQLTNVFVVSHIKAADAAPADFASGKAALGTGPYKMLSFKYGSGMELERNEAYRGPKPYYQHIRIAVIPNDSARIAALLAGDADLIDLVPPVNVAALEANPGVRVFKRVSDRIFYLQLDQRDHVPVGVTDAGGQPLTVNPFRDVKVRQALNMAIDRKTLIDRVLDGQGAATGQLVPRTFGAFDPDIPVPAHDPEGARKLIAEAGFPRGFGLLLACIPGDLRLCQAMAQMFSRVGVATNVESTPYASWYQRLAHNEIPVVVYSSSTASTRDASYTLVMALHSMDQAKGLGMANRGGYADPAMDRAIEAAVFSTGSDRDEKLKAVMAKAMAQAAVLPLYDEVTIAAGKRGLAYQTRVDEQLVAVTARPEQ